MNGTRHDAHLDDDRKQIEALAEEVKQEEATLKRKLRDMASAIAARRNLRAALPELPATPKPRGPRHG